LNYQVWFELEENWDYGYVEVSTNGGRTWEILKTPTTSPENPIGNNFGEGYTGDSKGWINERIDLSPYAGQEIQLRFQHITDDAVNGSGICLRGISIPELGFVDSLESVEGWQADGFLPISNRVKQDYIVQVIRSQELGSDEENSVTQMNLDKANVGEVLVVAPRTGERLVVAVAALAPKTRIEATYSLSVEPAD
jgi:bacillopeptidase F (M6 metalloprotease family)